MLFAKVQIYINSYQIVGPYHFLGTCFEVRNALILFYKYLKFALSSIRSSPITYKIKIILPSLLCILFGFGCAKNDPPDEYNAEAADPQIFHETATHLTDVIIHDIFKAPVASRIYGYSFLAAYEALVPAYPDYQSLDGQLVKFTAPRKPD